jgi:hypothetical protein
MPPSVLTSETQDLPSLITYQPGGIVSRTLIDKKAGTVTLFAFDQGQSLSEYTVTSKMLLVMIRE